MYIEEAKPSGRWDRTAISSTHHHHPPFSFPSDLPLSYHPLGGGVNEPFFALP